MRRNTLSLYLSLLPIMLFSQDYSVEWGTKYLKQSGNSTLQMEGVIDGNYHLSWTWKRKSSIMTFDLDHNLIKSQDVNIEKDGNELTFIELVETVEGAFALYNNYDQKKSEWQLFIRPFNNNQFGDVQLAYNFGIHQSTSPRRQQQPYFLEHLISSNKKRVAFINKIDSEENTDIAVVVLDEKMELIWNKTKEVIYPSDDFKIIQSVINNDGTIYVLGRVYNKKSIRKENSDLTKYEYKVFSITEDIVEEFEIQLKDDLLIEEAKLSLSPNNDVFVVSGFYKKEDEKDEINGLFVFSENEQLEKTISYAYPFDQTFLEEMLSDRELKKGYGISSSYNITDLFFFPDGSISFIAEEFQSCGSSSSSSPTYSTLPGASSGSMKVKTPTHTHSGYSCKGTMIIPRFNTELELINIVKIKKKFTVPYPVDVSYSLAIMNNKLFLLYPDSKEKEERFELRQRFRGGQYTDLTVINSVGEIEFQETLFCSKDQAYYLSGESDYTESHLFFIGAKGKKFSCGTIKLD